MKIHCLGVVVVDALSGPLHQYPVPRVRVQTTTETLRFMPGGCAANTACALAKMGLPAGVFSKVGDDLNGAFLLREFQRCGVDTSGLRLSAHDTTPFTFVGIHPDGDRTFIHTPGANKTFTPQDVDLDLLFAADFLFREDLWVIPGLDGQPTADLFAEARRRGVITLLDEGWGFGPNRDTLEVILPHCDYVTPSLDDLQVIYPQASAQAIAERLLAGGAGTVVMKMGAQGCLVAHGPNCTLVPALPARVVDTTGAGDCWNAGFVAALAHGEDLFTAALIGNAAAAFCIEATGGSSGIPDYATVRQRAALAQS